MLSAANDPHRNDARQGTLRALVIRVGGAWLALRTEQAREVFAVRGLTLLPQGRGVLLGLTAERGQVLPLINLAGLLGLSAPDPVLALVAEVAGERFAFPVDVVAGFELLSSVQAPEAGAITSVAGRPDGSPVQLIDGDAAFAALLARTAA